MSRIAETFGRLRGHGDKALVAALVAGDPDPAGSLAFFQALVHGGSDLVTIVIPHADPLLDGPTLRAAARRALRAGSGCDTALELAGALRRETQVPLLLATYVNPLLQWGEGRFFERCRAAGVDGLIVYDLPLEESAALGERAQAAGVDLVLMATPESDAARLRQLVEASRGFLYLASRHGVSGTEPPPGAGSTALIHKVRALSAELPLVVGFGLSTSDQLQTVLQAGADGSALGSALVQEVARGILPQLLQDRVRVFKAATRPHPPRTAFASPYPSG